MEVLVLETYYYDGRSTTTTVVGVFSTIEKVIKGINDRHRDYEPDITKDDLLPSDNGFCIKLYGKDTGPFCLYTIKPYEVDSSKR